MRCSDREVIRPRRDDMRAPTLPFRRPADRPMALDGNTPTWQPSYGGDRRERRVQVLDLWWRSGVHQSVGIGGRWLACLLLGLVSCSSDNETSDDETLDEPVTSETVEPGGSEFTSPTEGPVDDGLATEIPDLPDVLVTDAAFIELHQALVERDACAAVVVGAFYLPTTALGAVAGEAPELSRSILPWLSVSAAVSDDDVPLDLRDAVSAYSGSYVDFVDAVDESTWRSALDGDEAATGEFVDAATAITEVVGDTERFAVENYLGTNCETLLRSLGIWDLFAP